MHSAGSCKVPFLQWWSVVWDRLRLNRQYIVCFIVGGISIFSSSAMFMSPSVSWPYGHCVCCWKIRIENGMSKKKRKKGEEESTCTWVEKLKTNHRSWEHNSSHTRHLSSHTPLMFCDFTDKLREWSDLVKPACVTINFCVPTARDLSNFQRDLSSLTLWEQGFYHEWTNSSGSGGSAHFWRAGSWYLHLDWVSTIISVLYSYCKSYRVSVTALSQKHYQRRDSPYVNWRR